MYAETNRQVTSHALSSTANSACVAKLANKYGDVATARARVGQPSRPARMFSLMMRLWTDWRARRDLENLPDAVLSDIGLSRSDVVRETLQPFWTPLDYDTLETQRRRRATRRPERHG